MGEEGRGAGEIWVVWAARGRVGEDEGSVGREGTLGVGQKADRGAGCERRESVLVRLSWGTDSPVTLPPSLPLPRTFAPDRPRVCLSVSSSVHLVLSFSVSDPYFVAHCEKGVKIREGRRFLLKAGKGKGERRKISTRGNR